MFNGSAGEDADHLGDAIGDDVDDTIGDATDDAIDEATDDPTVGSNEDLSFEGKIRKGEDQRTEPSSETPGVAREESEIKTKAKRVGKKLNGKGGGGGGRKGGRGGSVGNGGGGKKRGRKPKAKSHEKPPDDVAQTDGETGLVDISTAAVGDSEPGGGDVDENLLCRICGETFMEKAKLHKHIWKHNRKRSHIW